MPFKSEKQRKWMWANEPEMAEKWANEEDEIEEGMMRITRRQLRRIIREAFLGKGGRVVPGAGLIGEIHMWVDHIAREPAYRNAGAAEVADAALDHIAGLGLQRDEAYEIALQRAIDMGLPT